MAWCEQAEDLAAMVPAGLDRGEADAAAAPAAEHGGRAPVRALLHALRLPLLHARRLRLQAGQVQVPRRQEEPARIFHFP